MVSILENKTNSLDKHKKYINSYGKNELYWGIGIENETYLQFDKKIKVTKDFFLKNHKRERYSVNYFNNYKDLFKNLAFDHLINSNILLENVETNEIMLPLLLNSHSFTYTDRNNNSIKLYTKLCEPNPKFNGTILGDELINYNSFFKDTFDKYWLYDGDTFEFTTLNFYNVKLEEVINELNYFKKLFIINVQQFQKSTELYLDYGKIEFMEENYPFAVYLTNLNNVGVFNNGTLHYNITLPTYLNEYNLIVDKNKFIDDHRKAIKIIQWFEPFLISVYNTPDFFSLINDFKDKNLFSKCSQRCAVSRYIGIGTYDSDTMIPGKILTISSDVFSHNKNWWYNKYHQSSAYNKLDSIGLDINFNKHYNHGIEIRFFDHIFDSNLIHESFEFIIYLIDYLLENPIDIPNPIYKDLWNNLVYNIMIYGGDYNLSQDEIKYYSKLIGIKIKLTNIKDVYYDLYYSLLIKYNKIKIVKDTILLDPIGPYSKLVLSKRETKSIKLLKKVTKFKSCLLCRVL